MSFRKALFVMGGEPPSEESLLWRKDEVDISIAVDAGWLSFIDAGIFPDVLIGDLDSWGGRISEMRFLRRWKWSRKLIKIKLIFKKQSIF